MSKQKIHAPKAATPSAEPATDGLNGWRVFLWLTVFANSLFIWPGCLDLSLAPRFLFLSLGLLVSIVLVFKDLRANGDFRLHGFDLLFLVWYGLNAASIGWAFNWSEAVFFTQKVLLGFAVYWLFRQALHRDESMVRRTLAVILPVLTLVVVGILLVQLGQAVSKVGLNNDQLYDYAKGVFGNKGLATDFLFFLLIFNVLLFREFGRKWLFWLLAVLLLGLILLLQTRTVYLAVAAGALVYFPVRAMVEPKFRPLFFKKILPGGLLAIGLLAALVAVKGRGTSLAERLNPMTYLESASANERRFVWYKTDLLCADHPIWGVGNGSWKLWFPSKSIQGAYRLQEKGIIFTRVHNDYLEIRAELGLVGAGLFILLFAVAAGTGFWVLRKTTDPHRRHDALVLLVGLLGYCIIQYFDFPRERVEMQVVLALFFAWLAFLSRDFWAKLPGLPTQKLFLAGMTFLATGLIFNVLIGWNRVRGEQHMVKTMAAHLASQWPTALRESALATNAFYEMNDVALPASWYAGVAHYSMKNYEKSVAAFAEAYSLNPWSFQVINNYASALVQHKDIPAAIKLYEKTLEINPKYDEGKFNLSYAYFQLGDYARSLEYANAVDTIVGAKTPDELAKNRAVLQRRETFIREIQKKKAAGGGQ